LGKQATLFSGSLGAIARLRTLACGRPRNRTELIVDQLVEKSGEELFDPSLSGVGLLGFYVSSGQLRTYRRTGLCQRSANSRPEQVQQVIDMPSFEQLISSNKQRHRHLNKKRLGGL
jgi:hypothetical protein